MMLRWLALCTLCATPLRADVAEVVDQYILPGYAAFADATKALDTAAKADCTAAALIPAYQAAFDAWLNVSILRFGPAEADGRSLAIQFWPDPKSLGAKAQARHLIYVLGTNVGCHDNHRIFEINDAPFGIRQAAVV